MAWSWFKKPQPPQQQPQPSTTPAPPAAAAAPQRSQEKIEVIEDFQGIEHLYRYYFATPPLYVLRADVPPPPTRYYATPGHRPRPLPTVRPEQTTGVWNRAVDEEMEHLLSGRYSSDDFRSLRVLMSPSDPVTLDNTRTFLATLARTQPPWFIFSLLGTKASVCPVFTAATPKLEELQQHILTYYPNATFAWHDTAQHFKAPSRALAMWCTNFSFNPIATFRDFNPDPFASLFSTVEHQCQPEETLALAVAFRPALPIRDALMEDRAGTEHILELTMSGHLDGDIQPIRQAFRQWKIASPPSWDVDIFTVATAQTDLRAAQLLEFFPRHFAQYDLAWEPLHTSYSLNPFALLERTPGYEVWERNIFNTDELAGLVHFPHKSVASPILLRATQRRKPVPDFLTPTGGLLLGTNEHYGTTKTVHLPQDLCSRHLYLVGASGTGKSTLLANLIKQDIETGAGFALIDPHGDLVADILPSIPEARVQDVIYFNPADRDYITPLNVMAVRTPEEKQLVADALIVTFRRLVESWGERMEHILRNTVYTLLEAGNKTFADIRRILVNPDFRSQVLDSISNEILLEFWEQEFPKLPSNATDPITNKFTKFLNPLDVTRYIFSVPDDMVNFSEILQNRKIFLANLSQGQLGTDLSHLLGAILVSQLQLAAMRRASLPADQRTVFTLYIDEFQNFTADEAFDKILSEARKYNLQLVLANQYIAQLSGKVANAIVANVHTSVMFRLGVDDANYMQKTLTGYTAEDLQNLDRGEAICRVGRAQDSFNLKTYPKPVPPEHIFVDQILDYSRAFYAIPTQELEQVLKTTKPRRSSTHPAPASTPAPPNAKEPLVARPKPDQTNRDKILTYVTVAEYLSTQQIIQLCYAHLTPTARQPAASRDLKPLVDEKRLKRQPFGKGNIYHTTRSCNPTSHNLALRDLLVKILRSEYELAETNFALNLNTILPDLYVGFLAPDGGVIKTLWEYDTGTEGVAEIIRKVKRYEPILNDYPLITCVVTDQQRLDHLRSQLPGLPLRLAVMSEFQTLRDPAFYLTTQTAPIPFFFS